MRDKKRRFLFVVEGAKREMDAFSNLASVFFNDKSDVIAIPVPADMNIYMLYDVMKKDGFETDIVEILKEKVPKAKEILADYTRDMFAEVYFFFDFDEHSNNLRKTTNIEALKEMLGVLNNETDLGKLYISYPMVEALRDYVEKDCSLSSGGCFINRMDFGKYKNSSSSNTKHNSVKDYTFAEWKDILYSFVMRSSCLFGIHDLDRDAFINDVNPLAVFNKQMIGYKENESIFVLSCLPEFIIDYSENYWNATLQRRRKFSKKKSCK